MNTELRFAHIGFGNVVCCNRVVAMIPPQGARGRAMLKKTKDEGTFIDGCLGRTMKTLLLLDNGYLMSSHIRPRTLALRFNAVEEGTDGAEDWSGLEGGQPAEKPMALLPDGSEWKEGGKAPEDDEDSGEDFDESEDEDNEEFDEENAEEQEE